MEIKRYNYDTKKMEVVADVSIRDVAKSLSPEDMADLLDDYCNNFSSGFRRGQETGYKLRDLHRTLQRSVIVELVGVIAGLAQQTHTDPRNADAVRLAQKILSLYEEEGAGRMV